jgi:hypothetical protein
VERFEVRWNHEVGDEVSLGEKQGRSLDSKREYSYTTRFLKNAKSKERDTDIDISISFKIAILSFNIIQRDITEKKIKWW